jgi:hypothetical protein
LFDDSAQIVIVMNFKDMDHVNFLYLRDKLVAWIISKEFRG